MKNIKTNYDQNNNGQRKQNIIMNINSENESINTQQDLFV